ncbi:Glyoxalase/Bleomycin resistance protein/Dioxygenase superfamily protein [uncultured archaeon]|nr:Glyoxalase/Bleomycin resistance protein/Dioxygenase superfamily protein [uncultured archaeon]
MPLQLNGQRMDPARRQKVELHIHRIPYSALLTCVVVREYQTMKKYEIEHIGIAVEKPIEMANWYQETLGFNIKFSVHDGEKGVAFITDCTDNVMLELGKIPNVSPLTDRLNHHLQLHIALTSVNPDKDAEYLVSKGAVFIEKCPIRQPGENLIVLSDPWGNTIQLVKRSE